MTQVNARLHFEKGFKGSLALKSGEIGIGMADNEARPYDMLQGALASCLHATFLDILEKRRIEISYADYVVEGKKKETPPTTLEKVFIKVFIPAHEKDDQIRKSMDLATKYCSVYETISQVASIEIEINFV